MERFIGRYKIEKVLGKGAMGKVYLAFDPVIERAVALKTIRVDRLDDDQEREEFTNRFFQEARICGKLHHPGAVTVHDLGSHEDEPFIVMEYVQGQDLAQRLREGPPLSRAEAMSVIAGLGDTLDAAHDLGIVHRDIKPQNIMLTTEGFVKILDFGIAKVTGSEMTADGTFWGTPAYAAPEQISERSADHRADIYAMGILVHRMLTGEEAFCAANIKKLFYKILHEPPRVAPALAHLCVDGRMLSEVLQRALAKDPDERHQRAGALKIDLLETFGDEDEVETHRLPAQAFATQTIPDGLLDPVEGPGVPGAHGTDDFDGALTTANATSPEATDKVRILRLRQQFRAALEDDNLIRARHLLRTLERKGVDAALEEQALNELLAHKESQDQALQQRLVHHKKNAFRQQLEAGDLSAATAVLESLKSLQAPIAEETSALAKVKHERQRLERSQRRMLEDALVGGRLGSAKVTLRKLQKLGVDTQAEAVKVAALEKEQMALARDRMHRITTARAQFQLARDEGDPEAAEVAIKHLKELGAHTQQEEGQLGQLAARLVMGHPGSLGNLHLDLKEAFKTRDWDEARELVGTLSLIEGEDEEKARYWQKRLDKVLSRQKRRTIAVLEQAFEEALDEEDIPRIHELEEQLLALGADSRLFHWLLARARGEEAGKRPIRRARVVAAAATTAVLIVIWFWFR